MTLTEVLQSDATNMMKDYARTKLLNEDCIIFYRLGDFYEFFFDDAVEMSRVLDLTLTGKDCGLSERAPMCGIPFHSAENYINKLIGLGYKVAICEQTSDVKTKKSYKDLVTREVVRIITPGTLIDEALLNEKKNNYLASIYIKDKKIGFSYVDISTGEFKTTEFSEENKFKELNDILVRIMPSEVLAFADEKFENDLPIRQLDLIPPFSYDTNDLFNISLCEEVLVNQFGSKFKDTFKLTKLQHAIIASGALLQYLTNTQKRNLEHINYLQNIQNEKYMNIDINTRRNLEILETLKDRRKKGSLIGVMDKTKTSMGARMFRSWIEQPLFDSKEINLRLDSVEELCGKIILRDNLSTLLKKCNDIERLCARASYGNFIPKDSLGLANSLNLIPFIKEQLKNCSSPLINDIYNNLGDFKNLTDEILKTIKPEPANMLNKGGYINNGVNEELDDYRSAREKGKQWISNYEILQKEETGIKNLKIGYNNVYGYYIEVNKQYLMNVPLTYVRKQTVSNNERYFTDELKAIEEKIEGADEKAVKLEQQLFNNLKDTINKYLIPIQTTSKQLAKLDCLLSLSEVAIKNNYCKPKINSKSNNIIIQDGRHPVVESLLKEQFIPNNTHLDTEENRTMVITGPNMAGKSTYMRQVALITLLAHIGSFVPAKQAEIALTDQIFTRVGASDDLALGQSTFMVEMMEVASILKNATNKSLIILDEIGRGTSTFDGLSIAWSVVEYLSNNMNAKTLFSTHYHELTELENFLPGVKNYKISVKEIAGGIVFLRKIVRGGASRSFGIEVAALAGVPNDIINRAKEISNMLEQTDSAKNLALKANQNVEQTQEKDIRYTEIIGILKDLDINTITPISAFEILLDLTQKVKK